MRMVLALTVASALSWTGVAAVPASGATTPPAGRLSGRVVDVDGAAVAGAAINAVSTSAGGGTAAGQSDAGGTFSLAAPQGSYDLTVTAAARTPPLQGRLRGVAIGADSKLTVVLVPGPGAQGPGSGQITLSGTLRDTTGQLLPGASVSLSDIGAPWGWHSTTTGSDGTFSINVAPAHYGLSVSRYTAAANGAPQSSFSLNAPDVDVTTSRRLDFTVPVATVTVAVRTPSGAAVPSAQVTASLSATSPEVITIAPGVSAQASWSTSGQTDSQGRIVFLALPTQSLYVSAQPAGRSFGSGYRNGLRVAGDTLVELVTPEAANLRGIVSDFDGSPVVGAVVRLAGAGIQGLETTTAPDGSYSLYVSPGSYQLSLWKGTQYTAAVPNQYLQAIQAIQIDGDLTQDLRVPGIRVPVHVSDPSGAPVAGASVTAYNSYPSGAVKLFPGVLGQGLRGGTVVTDAAGNATLTVFDGESAMVSAQPPDGSGLASSLSQTLTLTTSSNLSFALRPTVTLSGVVNATPASGFRISASGAFDSAGPKTTAADGAYRLQVAPGNWSLSISSTGQSQSKTDRPEHFVLNSRSFEVTADRTLDLTPPFVHATVRAYDQAGGPVALGSVPYGIGATTQSGVDVPLGSGLRASYAYFDGTGVAQSSKSARLAVLPSVPFWIQAQTENATLGTLPGKSIVIDGDADVALVAATDPSGGTGTTTTTTTTTGTPPTGNPDQPSGPVAGSPAAGGDHPRGTARSGYWALGADGLIYPFGDAASLGNPSALLGGATAVHLEPTPSGNGYWVVDSQGRVFTYGDAGGHGRADPAKFDRGETVTSLSATPSGKGYWIFTTAGRVLPFGDAAFLGDMSRTRLNAPVVDSRPTPSGQGYYMVAADGGIFSFGDAAFHGSMGGTRLNAPVRSLVPDPDGTGYWLVAADGGVFAFNAGFRGSLGGIRLNRPVSGMVPYGNGYLMVGEDGGVFNFSDRPFSGSLGSRPPEQPVISVGVLPI